MPTEISAKKLVLIPAALVVVGAALAGCGSDEGFKGAAEAAGLATTPQESKAFVRETRAAEIEYIPVGTTIPVANLCQGAAPPPAYVPSGQAARFAAPKPIVDPKDACKPRSDFKAIEKRLDGLQKANQAAGETAKALGATPPPEPAKIPRN